MIVLIIFQLLAFTLVESRRNSGGYQYIGNGNYQGPRGGKFYINENGHRTYF